MGILFAIIIVLIAGIIILGSFYIKNELDKKDLKDTKERCAKLESYCASYKKQCEDLVGTAERNLADAKRSLTRYSESTQQYETIITKLIEIINRHGHQKDLDELKVNVKPAQNGPIKKTATRVIKR